MKKLILTTIGVLAAVGAFAQGTINFANGAVGVSAPISDNLGALLSGTAYKADVFYGAVGANPSTFTSLGLNNVTFLTGGGAGFFNGGTRVLPIAGGTSVQVQVRAWRVADGADWATASAAGLASPITAPVVTVVLGNPGGTPATTPANLTGLASHNLVLAPEPSTILLGLAGIGSLLFLRRKIA